MDISAIVRNSYGENQVTLTTNDNSHSIAIPPKLSGFGSSANGGELLFLAVATCYCNDIFREAAKRGIKVEQVEVEVKGRFEAEGTLTNLTYTAKIAAQATEADIRELGEYTDTIAEVHNVLRTQTAVNLDQLEVVSVQT